MLLKNKLDLFKLNNVNEDLKPKSWICVYGRNLQLILNKLVNEIIQKHCENKKTLAKIIAQKLNCNIYTIYNFLRGKRRFIPIVVISILLDIYRKRCDKSFVEIENIKEKIQDAIGLLKNNTSNSFSVRVPRELNTNLARMAGAYAADGNMTLAVKFLSKKFNKLLSFRLSIKKLLADKLAKRYTRIIYGKYGYEFTLLLNSNENDKLLTFLKNKNLSEISIFRGISLTIVDEYRESLEYLATWFEKCFDVKPAITKLRNQNAWYIKVSNKIIGRYFNQLLGFPFGRKHEIVKEPEIIKNSNYNFRKAFAQGAITFDGSVLTDGRIVFSSKSRYLIRSLSEIIQQNINSNVFDKSIKGGVIHIRTRSIRKHPHLLEFLVEGTEKYKILYRLLYGSQQKSSENTIIRLLETFPRHSKIKLITIFKAAKDLKEFNLRDLATYIKNNEKIALSKQTINPLIMTLNSMNIVKKKTKIYVKLDENFREQIFQDVLKTLKTRKKLGELLNVVPETTYDYHMGKVNIPQDKLIQILKLVNLNLFDVSDYILLKREGINPTKSVFKFNSNLGEWRI